MAGVHEIFNPVRVGKCLRIFAAIVEHVVANSEFAYEIRAPFTVTGRSLDELKNEYVEIGPDADRLKAVPFIDLLVIIDLLVQWNYHYENNGENKTFKPEITTHFSEDRIGHYLSMIKFQTPLLLPESAL